MRTSSLTNRGLTLSAIVTLALLMVLAALVAGASPASAQGSAPNTPDQPSGTAVFIGGVDLEWNEVRGADSYGVQMSRNGQWTDLPGDGIEIAFYGAGAIISELEPEGSSYWFRVRARNAHGSSEWSDFNFMAPTNESRLGRRARPDNVPASGEPVISGTGQVGESLTADTTGIEDGNGLDRVKFRFQWVSHDGSADTDIANATDSTYTLVAADEGKTIKVRVAFTDRGGFSELLTGGETATVADRPNSPATGAPSVTGTAQVGETLAADTSGIADADGLTKVSYSYQWVANDGNVDTDITDAAGSTYTLAAYDEGKTIKVKVSFSDDAGNEETLTSSATAAVDAAPNTPATGAPAISGTAQVGERLTADTSGIADADGLTKVSYSYQWVANDGTADTDITDATDSTYTLAAADEGRTVKVKVSFTDDAENGETLTSSATAAVEAAPNTPATGAPAISGTAQVGETLTADTSGISDADGLASATFAYQWLADDAELASATGGSHVLTTSEMDKTIKVRVSFTDDAGNEETLTSRATGTVSPAVQPQTANSPATGAPIITGTAQVGETLTADTSGIADAEGLTTVSYGYQWVANDGTLDTDITGATDSTYTLAAADEGKAIKVKVSFTDDAGNGETLTSSASAAVEAPEPPALPTGLSPSVSHGTVTLTWDDPQDDSITGYVILRRDRAIHPVGTFVTITDDTGSADTTYTDDTVEPDKRYVYRIKAINEHGEVSERSDWVRANTPAVPVPDKPTGLSTVVSYNTVTLTWDDPQDDSITGYVILRRDREIHPVRTFVTIAGDTGSADTTYTDDTVEPEKQYNYKIEAINEHGEVSERSDWVRANTPAAPQPNSPATGEPTITGTAQVGETLTADTSGIADDDGLTTSTYSYQWVASNGTTDTNIAAATDSTYDLVAADAGKTIKVRVSFTDDGGYAESLTSTATDIVSFAVQLQTSNSPATGAPVIAGTIQVGETLTADTSSISDADGLTNVSYQYQWIRNEGTSDTEIASATDSTYALTDDDEGKHRQNPCVIHG